MNLPLIRLVLSQEKCNIIMVYCSLEWAIQSVATVGTDEEDATGALLEYEIQEGAGSVELGFFI
jgi:hypothetical protein